MADRPWWREMDKTALAEWASQATTERLQVVIAEVKGSTISCARVVQDTDRDHDTRTRARHALADMSEKKAALSAELQRRAEQVSGMHRLQRAAVVRAARELLEQGDTRGAVEHLLTWIEGFGREG